jgi:hypothetical protein
MALVGPDGAPLEDEPITGPGKPLWRVPRGKLGVIEVHGPDAVSVETSDARFVLEPGGDYLIVARELYLRLVTELSVYKDHEKRALAWMIRRQKRGRARDERP